MIKIWETAKRNDKRLSLAGKGSLGQPHSQFQVGSVLARWTWGCTKHDVTAKFRFFYRI